MLVLVTNGNVTGGKERLELSKTNVDGLGLPLHRIVLEVFVSVLLDEYGTILLCTPSHLS